MGGVKLLRAAAAILPKDAKVTGTKVVGENEDDVWARTLPSYRSDEKAGGENGKKTAEHA
jgi:hypothetical protein